MPSLRMYARYHDIFLLSSQKQFSFELRFNYIFKAEPVTHLSMLIQPASKYHEGSLALIILRTQTHNFHY